MKLIELLEVMSDRNEVGIYYRDRHDNLVEIAHYDGRNSIDEKFNKCEVEYIGTDFDEGKVCTDVIVNGIAEYSTWLDITYSLKVNLDCPIACEWEDVKSDFYTYANELIEKMPKTLSVDGMVFEMGETGVDTGHYFEMIE